MNTNLAQLIKLSKLDENIDAFAPKIAAAKQKSDELTGKIASLERKNATIDESTKELIGSRVRTENLISELGEKLKSIKAKAATVSKEKEIQTLSVEEDIANEQLNKANADIERLEAQIAELKVQKQENEKNIIACKDELVGAEAEFSVALKAFEKERALVYAQKEELAKNVDAKLLSFYEKIRKWAKNTAVVPVRKRACYGCFMQLNSKVYSMIEHTDEINTCPHCGRIIYLDTDYKKGE